MFTNNLTGDKFSSKIAWQETMSVGNPHNLDVNTQLGISANDCVAAFVFGDGMMIAKQTDGSFYTIVCQDEAESKDPQEIIDFLWSALYIDE